MGRRKFISDVLLFCDALFSNINNLSPYREKERIKPKVTLTKISYTLHYKSVVKMQLESVWIFWKYKEKKNLLCAY